MRYLRRDVLRAGARIGAASAVLMAKAPAAARLSAQAGQSIENLGNLTRIEHAVSQNRHPQGRIG
jgi:hypothetical protein